MSHHVLALGAGFGGLELATCLSESGEDVHVTLIDEAAGFTFGFKKLDVMMGHQTADEVRLDYDYVDLHGVEFRRERVTAIDPEERRVTTEKGSYDGDFLVVALGADYDFGATPGFTEHAHEYYSSAGAERLSHALPSIESGRIVIAIMGHPFKCPPAPFEGAFLIHDMLAEKGVRSNVEITTLGPVSAPVCRSRPRSRRSSRPPWHGATSRSWPISMCSRSTVTGASFGWSRATRCRTTS
jgi:sulfide:quinone oxidoreductase